MTISETYAWTTVTSSQTAYGHDVVVKYITTVPTVTATGESIPFTVILKPTGIVSYGIQHGLDRTSPINYIGHYGGYSFKSDSPVRVLQSPTLSGYQTDW